MTELWLSIYGFKGRYSVSNLGRVRNDRTQNTSFGSNNGQGYLRVALSKKGSVIQRFAHVLVAKAFLGNSRGRQVDHIDRVRDNNKLSNLRFATPKQNSANRSTTKREYNQTPCESRLQRASRPVLQTSLVYPHDIRHREVEYTVAYRNIY